MVNRKRDPAKELLFSASEDAEQVSAMLTHMYFRWNAALKEKALKQLDAFAEQIPKLREAIERMQ
jgi:hypothetical protein